MTGFTEPVLTPALVHKYLKISWTTHHSTKGKGTSSELSLLLQSHNLTPKRLKRVNASKIAERDEKFCCAGKKHQDKANGWWSSTSRPRGTAHRRRAKVHFKYYLLKFKELLPICHFFHSISQVFWLYKFEISLIERGSSTKFRHF